LIQINAAPDATRNNEIMPLYPVCSSHGALAAGGGFAALLLIGVSGSLLHCGPMCGPLVLGQSTSRLACLSCAQMSEGARLRAGVLLPYHAGRLCTYTVLGGVAGLAGQQAAIAAAPLRVIMLIAAAATLVMMALRGHVLPPARTGGAGFARLFTPGGFLFGVALGFLPCGLLYTALLAAMATGSAPWGALGMAGFGLGTVPLLAAIGVTGHMVAASQLLRRVLPYCLLINASLVLLAAFGAARPL
jgi:sulfite exporter TauE/SafE